MSNTMTFVLQNYPATKTLLTAEIFFLLFPVSKACWSLHTAQLHLWAVYTTSCPNALNYY